ncbi:hypothetical protein [Hyalangium versicolor]|uniref:hypothetical protein n=1 Tax=Hyalangium versicolor TaxID=2861190 RepID=UPI001CD01AE3|nr:hypothetical protein [Hyalangium versicolor]
MASSKVWIPPVLVLGWVLGYGTSWFANPLAGGSSSSPEALEQLSARIDALPARLAMSQGQARCVVSAPAPDLSALRTEIRQALREECSTGMEPSPPEKAAETVPPQEVVLPQTLATLEQGQRLLDEALRTRRWGDTQAEELRSLFPELTPSQRQALTQKLIVSINRGELTVETSGLPF